MAFHVDWDPDKAEQNLERHEVSFEEAAEALEDPLSHTIEDTEHSEPGEQRLRTIGHSRRGKLLVVIHTEDRRRIRIISAWRATRRERAVYEEGE